MSRTDKASGCHQPASPCSLPVSGRAGGDLLLSTPEFVGSRMSSVHFKGCQKISRNKLLLFQSGHWDNERPPSSFAWILLIDVGSCVLTWSSTECVCVCSLLDPTLYKTVDSVGTPSCSLTEHLI